MKTTAVREATIVECLIPLSATPLKLIALSQVESPGWTHFTFNAQLVAPKRRLRGSQMNI